MVLVKLRAGDRAFDLNANSKAKLTFRLDRCIDGASKDGVTDWALEMKLDGAMNPPNGVETKIDINAKDQASKIQEDLTGKK